MQKAKDEVLEILEQLPEDVTLEEIQYRLYVRQKIRRGLDDVQEERIFSHEQIEARMKKWIEK